MSTNHNIAEELVEFYSSRDFNEADTRHQIIDRIIHEVLSWPRNAVSCESYIDGGYADYVLKGKNDRELLFVEAKREGFFFQIPFDSNHDSLSTYIPVKTLITDDNIKKAILQVREYCTDTGCEFGAITNGHEWIFFKTFEKGKNWKELRAFVVKNLQYFSDCYIDATNNLGYSSVTSNFSLQKLLGSQILVNRVFYFPRNNITSYNESVNQNRLSKYLRPLLERYLGPIDGKDSDFMDKCYVSQRDYQNNHDGVQNIIRDSLTPYFEEYNVTETADDSKGGAFGSRIAESASSTASREVLVLFGGKGSGKSTFVRKLLYHKPPKHIIDHSNIAIVDLLNCPEDQEVIHKEILVSLCSSLDKDRLLSASRNTLLELFKDKYLLATRQILTGLDIKSEAYNLKLNELVGSWKGDLLYCAKRLCSYWDDNNRGIIIVLDNTDQFSREIQDYCFAMAKYLAEELNCISIISMREERFYSSKIHGTLDAFKNSGFHLSSPTPQRVFEKRLEYILDALQSDHFIDRRITETVRGDIDSLLRVFLKEVRRSKSAINMFLVSCTHGNIRLALEFLKEILLSGYTNVDELIANPSWILKEHQVLKPMMIPQRFFYDEATSKVPNIYQIRSKTNGSHFTGLRILELLISQTQTASPTYVATSQIRSYFADTFNMVEDCEGNLDAFLKYGIVEANNRLDEYSEEVDSVKITAYGEYIFSNLYYMFTYLELVCSDCGIYDESTSNYIARASNDDMKLFRTYRKLERIMRRIDRTEEFIKYLQKEETREIEFYSHESKVIFSEKLAEEFKKEKESVIASAKRNV